LWRLILRVLGGFGGRDGDAAVSVEVAAGLADVVVLGVGKLASLACEPAGVEGAHSAEGGSGLGRGGLVLWGLGCGLDWGLGGDGGLVL
jgi:hypothetical protein